MTVTTKELPSAQLLRLAAVLDHPKVLNVYTVSISVNLIHADAIPQDMQIGILSCNSSSAVTTRMQMQIVNLNQTFGTI
jgi:hypothetical protein